jgi:hypothetical protein
MAEQAVAVASATLWSGSAAMAVPHFREDLSVDTELAEDGVSLRFRKTKTGKAFAYLPMTIPQGASLRYIEIVAQCEFNSKKESVSAEIFRVSRAGVTQALGAVNTVAKKQGAGIHRWSAEFPAHNVDVAKHSYYIRLTLSRTEIAANPSVFSVLVAGRCSPDGPVHCPPGPDPPLPL